MKILCIDIETTPNLAHVWGLWDQNIGLNQLLEATEMLCFAAKWVGDPKMFFGRKWFAGPGVEDDKEQMIGLAHSLLDQADVVMHFNGKRFDVPHLNREFLMAGWKPPSPYKQIDLLSVVRKQFKFPSNKLEYVSKALGLAGKTKHEGHTLWIKCMAGDEKAWRKMRVYNKQDVRLLEEMYEVLKPWVIPHPNFALYEEGESIEDQCPGCGSTELNPQGFAITSLGKYQRFQCGGCGKWSRSSKRAGSVQVQDVVL
jgi:hypothetical protein